MNMELVTGMIEIVGSASWAIDTLYHCSVLILIALFLLRHANVPFPLPHAQSFVGFFSCPMPPIFPFNLITQYFISISGYLFPSGVILIKSLPNKQCSL